MYAELMPSEPSPPLSSLPEETDSQLDPTAPTFSPLEPLSTEEMPVVPVPAEKTGMPETPVPAETMPVPAEKTGMPAMPVPAETTGRWPESSSNDSFGSLKHRDICNGKKPGRPPQKFKSSKVNDNSTELLALRRELRGTHNSLGAAHDKIDALTSTLRHLLISVQQVGHDVSRVAHDVSVATEQTNPVLLAAANRVIGPPTCPPEPRLRQPLPVSLPPSIVETWGSDTTLPVDHEDEEYPSIVPDYVEAPRISSMEADATSSCDVEAPLLSSMEADAPSSEQGKIRRRRKGRGGVRRRNTLLVPRTTGRILLRMYLDVLLPGRMATIC